MLQKKYFLSFHETSQWYKNYFYRPSFVVSEHYRKVSLLDECVVLAICRLQRENIIQESLVWKSYDLYLTKKSEFFGK